MQQDIANPYEKFSQELNDHLPKYKVMSQKEITLPIPFL